MTIYESNYSDTDAARAEYPGAVAILPVEGGWMVFRTWDDLAVWEAQQ